MSVQLLADLKDLVASSPQRPVLVCGAGVSIAATNGAAPSWMTLLQHGVEAVQSLYSDEADWAAYAHSRLRKGKLNEWLDVADEVTSRLGGSGNAEFASWIANEVGRIVPINRELLDAISGLNCIIATTNYDDILTNGLQKFPITWDDPAQVHRFLNNQIDGILYLHGHWRKPETIVLGTKSYSSLINNESVNILSEYFSLRAPVIYIGCSSDGLSDPHFTHLAAFMADWQLSAPRSYWLTKTGQGNVNSTFPQGSNPRLFNVEFGQNNNELSSFLSSLIPVPAVSNIVLGSPTCIEHQEPRPDLYGREDELCKIENALINGRSVTIGGGPGVGKTSLAIGALYRQKISAKFGIRRVFVSLESERDPHALLTGLASSLKLPTNGDESSLLRQIEVASSSNIVVIVDNVEHILENDRINAERVLRLVAQIQNLCLVVTTRGSVPRIIGAEAIQDLGKLDKAAAEAAFLNLAGHQYRGDPDLEPLLDALDGHALSIELVAAQVADGTTLYSVRQAWKELRAAILKRFGVAEGRLTSVRASLALSLQSMILSANPAAKRLIAILSVLPIGLRISDVTKVLGERGGFSKARASEAALVLQQLKLVEKRLDDRLRMLTPLREAARLDVNLLAADRKRLLSRYIELCSSSSLVGTSHWENVSIEVEMEVGNFPSIISLAMESRYNPSKLLEANYGLSEYYRFSGQGSISALYDSLEYFKKIGSLDGSCRLLSYIAGIQMVRDNLFEASVNFKESLRLASIVKNNNIMATCLSGLGKIAAVHQDLIGARKYLYRSIQEYSALGDLLGQANQFAALAGISKGEDAPDAKELYEKAFKLFNQAGDELGETNVKLALLEEGWVESNNFDCRAEALQDAAGVFARLGVISSELRVLNRCAFMLQADMKFDDAIQILNDNLLRTRQNGFVILEAYTTILKGIVERRSSIKDWSDTTNEGFRLLRQALRSDDPSRPAYDALEEYLTSDSDEHREIARNKARSIWAAINKKDYARLWLDTPVR